MGQTAGANREEVGMHRLLRLTELWYAPKRNRRGYLAYPLAQPFEP